MEPSRRLRVAVVGVGHLGQHHARVLSELPEAELVAVCDVSLERAQEVAERFGVEHTADVEALFGRVDAVCVATPTDSHLNVAKRFLDQGIHCLVEKPLADSVASARELVQAAEAGGALLQVGHIERFNPALVAGRKYLTRPRFISCERVSPFSFRSADIGVVMDLMIHDLDVVLHLMQEPVVDVDALGVPVLAGHEDIAHARLRFADGSVAVLNASRVSVKKVRKIRIFQPDCYMSLDYAERRGVVFRKRPGFELGKAAFDDVDPTMAPEMLQAVVFSRFLEIEQLSMEEAEPLKLELESFVQSVRTGAKPVVSGYDGLRAIEIAERIQQVMLENLKQEQHRLEA